MVTQCKYCGSRAVVINADGLYVCAECATEQGPLFVRPLRRLNRKERLHALLYGYV